MNMEAYRQHIEAQTCPFCGKGPFKSLVQHTGKGHGVNKWELRDLAGLTSLEPITSPELREKMRANLAANVNFHAAPRHSGERGPNQHKTKAGSRNCHANLLKWQAENPEEAAEQQRQAGILGSEAKWGGVTTEDRFWQKVDVSDECWLWTGGKNHRGNPTMYDVATPHRFAWELLVGKISEGLELHRLCGNGLCVRPDHMEPVTPRESQMRSGWWK